MHSWDKKMGRVWIACKEQESPLRCRWPDATKYSWDKKMIVNYGQATLTDLIGYLLSVGQNLVHCNSSIQGKRFCLFPLQASIEDGIYEDLVIDGSSAVTQLRFSADNQSLYTLSSKKVTMVPLQECDAYTSCDACVRRNDPFCGWCTLYKKWVWVGMKTISNPLNYSTFVVPLNIEQICILFFTYMYGST